MQSNDAVDRLRSGSTLPIALAIAVAWLLVPFGGDGTDAWLLPAAAATIAGLGAAVLLPWRTSPAGLRMLAPVLVLLGLALLRHAEGGASSGYAPLLLIAVCWVALEGTDREVAAAVMLVGTAFLAPVFLVGEPSYPDTELRRATFALLVGAVVATGIVSKRRALQRAEQAARTNEGFRVNQDVVQSLAVAQLHLQRGDAQAAEAAVSRALAAGMEIASGLAEGTRSYRLSSPDDPAG